MATDQDIEALQRQIREVAEKCMAASTRASELASAAAEQLNGVQNSLVEIEGLRTVVRALAVTHPNIAAARIAAAEAITVKRRDAQDDAARFLLKRIEGTARDMLGPSLPT